MDENNNDDMLVRLQSSNSLYREIDQRRAWNRSLSPYLNVQRGCSFQARQWIRTQVLRNRDTIDEIKVLVGNRNY